MNNWERKNPDKVRECKRRYQSKNREIINAKRRAWQKLHTEECRLRGLEYRSKNRASVRARQKRHYAKNQVNMRAQALRYMRRKDRSAHLSRRRQLRLKRREQLNQRQSEWRRNNKAKVRAYANKARATRMLRDFNFAIKERLRTRVRQALKDQLGVKAWGTIKLLGCSVEDFRIYIESKFQIGMDWSNWGHGSDKWNLDHIMPCAIFDLTQPEHQKRCFHFSNYQPLWQPDNFAKHDKVITNQFQLL